MKIFLSLVMAMCLTAGSVAVFAADGDKPAGEHRMHKPPQAALDACKDLAENANCQFTGRNDQIISGVCTLPPADSETKTLACRPSHSLKDKPHAPE